MIMKHKDAVAVSAMADKMLQRMAEADDKGKSGWDDPHSCSTTHLAELLMRAVHKGDFVSVANYAMMLELRETPPCVLEVVAKLYLIDPLKGG